jgi:hypothetical protein
MKRAINREEKKVPEEQVAPIPPPPAKKIVPMLSEIRLSVNGPRIVSVRVLPQYVLISDGNRAQRLPIKRGKPVTVTVMQ